MTSLATLIVDDFQTGTVPNATRWPTVSPSSGGSVPVSGGTMRLQHGWDLAVPTFPPPFTSVWSAVGEITSGVRVWWKYIPLLTNDGGAGHAHKANVVMGVANQTNDEGFGWRHEPSNAGNGAIFAEVWNDIGDEWRVDVGSIAVGTYAPGTTHMWLGLRRDATTFYWDTAPDNAGQPGTWTQRFSYSQSGAGVSFDSMAGFLGTNGAAMFYRAYHWDENFSAAMVTQQPQIDGVNGKTVNAVAIESVADPATYTFSPSVNTKGVIGFSSIALPATYSFASPNTGFAMGKLSIADPAVYSMTVPDAADLVVYSSVALPADYTMNLPDVVSGWGRFSVADPAVYAYTPADATARQQANPFSIALPAVYTMNGMDISIRQNLISMAVPAAFFMLPFETAVEHTGEEEKPVYLQPVGKEPLSELDFLAWMKSETAIRVVLVETECLDGNGNPQQLFFGSRGFVTKLEDGTQGRAYLPLIKGGMDFQQTLGLDLSGNLSFGDIELDNTEGDLDWVFDRVWRYRPVRAYIGDARWPRRDFRQIFDGVVEDIDSSQRDTVNMHLRDKLYRLDMPLHENKVGGTNANPDELLPACFGECHNVTPVLVEPNELRYAYHCRAAETAFEVRDNGVPIQRLTAAGAPATFTLPKQPYGRVTASVQGDNENGYLNQVGPLIRNLVKNWGTESLKRFTDEDIDQLNFELFELNNREAVGLYVTQRVTVLEACQQIAAAVGARLTMTAQGKLQLVRVEIPPVGTPIEVGESDILAGSLRIINRLSITPSTRLGYCKNWTIQEDTASGIPEEHKALFSREWLTVTSTNQVARELYNLWAEPEQENCLLLTEDDATVECTRRTSLRSYQRHVYEFVGFSDLILTPVGAPMKLTHRRFGLQQGKVGQVVAVAVGWLDSTVTIQVVI